MTPPTPDPQQGEREMLRPAEKWTEDVPMRVLIRMVQRDAMRAAVAACRQVAYESMLDTTELPIYIDAIEAIVPDAGVTGSKETT